jgi:serine phosphatase RsbU (regulator of sigma subunit)
VTYPHPHPWPQSDRDLLAACATLVAQTLERIGARDAEREAGAEVARFSETLQRSLLSGPTAPTDLQVAVRYVPAASQVQVGGDWYDAFVTSEGTTSLVIGDVTGHDRHAAAAMAQFRNLLRGIGYAIGQPPATILSVLDQAAHDLGVAEMATVVLAQVHRSPQQAAGLRTLRWSNAGHLPPLLLAPDGTTCYLDTAPDLLMGLDPATSRTDHELLLAPGSTVLFFTDGLVERRGAWLQDGLDWLARAAADVAHLPPEQICDALLAQVGDRVEDDVALLVLRTDAEESERPR